jgi:hypothetical protein
MSKARTYFLPKMAAFTAADIEFIYCCKLRTSKVVTPVGHFGYGFIHLFCAQCFDSLT